MPSAVMPWATRTGGRWRGRLVAPEPRQRRSSRARRTVGLSCWQSGCVAEYGPARGDQVKGIILRHLHDPIQTDIDVSAREGLDRTNPRWRLDADVHRPWRFPFFGLSLELRGGLVLCAVVFVEAPAVHLRVEHFQGSAAGIDLIVM